MKPALAMLVILTFLITGCSGNGATPILDPTSVPEHTVQPTSQTTDSSDGATSEVIDSPEQAQEKDISDVISEPSPSALIENQDTDDTDSRTTDQDNNSENIDNNEPDQDNNKNETLYTINGTVSGLSSFLTVYPQYYGDFRLDYSVSDYGSSSFGMNENESFSIGGGGVPTGTRYSLSISSMPRNHECTIIDGSGIVNSSNIEIKVDCIDKTDREPPLLTVPIVNLSGVYDPATKRLGGLDCQKGCEDCNYCFSPLRIFDIYTIIGADIFAPCDGVITRVSYQEGSDDYFITMQPSQHSVYEFEFDHITNLTVTEGDEVTAGQKLGEPWTLWGRGRIEFVVYNFETDSGVCPASLGDADFVAAFEAALAAHNLEFPENAYPSLCDE